MAIEYTIHDIFSSCITPPKNGAIGTFLKNFGPLIVSTLSLRLAWSVSRITKNQKEINRKSYNLNLFKERFSLWKKFNAQKCDYEIKIEKFFEIEPQRKHGIDLEEIFDKALSEQSNAEEISSLLKEIKFLFRDPENNFKEVIEAIEYNINISHNHQKYKDIFSKYKDLNNLIFVNNADYDEKFAEIFRRIIITYEFIDKELLVIDNYDELKIFYTDFKEKYRKMRNLKCAISQKEEKICIVQKNKNFSHGDEGNIIKIKKEIQQHRKSLMETEIEFNNLKEINRNLIECINAIEIEIKLKLDKYEKELKNLYFKSTMKGNFFKKVNDMMEYYLDVDK